MDCEHKWTLRTETHEVGNHVYPKTEYRDYAVCETCGEKVLREVRRSSRYWGD